MYGDVIREVNTSCRILELRPSIVSRDGFWLMARLTRSYDSVNYKR